MFASQELIATPTQQRVDFPLEYLSYIVNDGNADIHVGLQPLEPTPFRGSHTKAYFVIKPGESVGGLKIRITRIYFRSVSGSQPFRIGGIPKI